MRWDVMGCSCFFVWIFRDDYAASSMQERERERESGL